MILAIDPGATKSAWIVITPRFKVVEFAIQDNDSLRFTLKRAFNVYAPVQLTIEMIASYGMPVGKSVFETCVWIGRFIEAWPGSTPTLITRNIVKNAICHSSKANDANIRQALIDLYPATGGGKTPQIGTKKNPGPLYGVSKDVWAALAVAVTFAGIKESEAKDAE